MLEAESKPRTLKIGGVRQSARRGDGPLRFPDPGIGRKTSGSQNIKGDVQGYSCLTECEIDRDFRARNDLRKLYFLALHRDIALAIEDSRELIAPQNVHGKVMTGL